MTFSIYALRVRGDAEVRYIGLTSKTPESRIAYEKGTALARSKFKWCVPSEQGQWLLENDVEGVVLSRVLTKAEAHAKEREMVEVFAKLGHRLFNRWLVPAEFRRAA